MKLRKLNDDGIAQFWDYLTALRQEKAAPIPTELLEDTRFSTIVAPASEIIEQDFGTKIEAGKYLHQALHDVPSRQLRQDVGLWAWLSVFYFDVLCPANGHGRRTPKELAKYISRPGDHRYGLDKHLLFFPWKLVSMHGENAKCFLMGPVGQDTRAQREWTGYHLNVAPSFMELASRLYSNDDGTSLKRDATGKKGGNLRRFVQIAKQLQLTYDVFGMNADQLQALLPQREFSKWFK